MGKGSVQALPTPTPLLPPGGAATTISPTSATSTPGLFLPVQMTSETNVQSLQRPFCLHLLSQGSWDTGGPVPLPFQRLSRSSSPRAPALGGGAGLPSQQLGDPSTDTVLILASPGLAQWLYFVRCEGEGDLQHSSFPDGSQDKGVWVVGGQAGGCEMCWGRRLPGAAPVDPLRRGA